MLHHYLAKYSCNGIRYAEAWIQINIFGKRLCLWRKRIRLGTA